MVAVVSVPPESSGRLRSPDHGGHVAADMKQVGERLEGTLQVVARTAPASSTRHCSGSTLDGLPG